MADTATSTAGGPASAPAPGVSEAAPDNRWQAGAADIAAFAAGPVRAALSDWSVLEFTGDDAGSFLQGQTTIDIAALAAGHWQLGGYCTPKGRLLAIFLAGRDASAIRLILPTAVASGVQRRLGMYVLRAKVKIRDATADWTLAGLLGAGTGARLAAGGIAVPAAAGAAVAVADGGSLVRLAAGAGAQERYLSIAPAGSAVAPALAPPAVGPAMWWWSVVDAGVPVVVAGTQERFVPQAVNLEVLGGVNFRKGCYPGQEIVARSQYLGKLRRRMFLGHADRLGPSSDVYAADAAEPLGRIVLAAGAPAGGWDLLFECPTERVDGALLHAGSPDAPALQIRALPYTLFDPTA